jgi:hypothetical protein
MGDYFQTIVDLDAGEAQAAELAERAVAWLVSEGIVLADREICVLGQPLGHPPGPHWSRAVTDDDPDGEPFDGLAVHIGRTVFDSGQDGPEAVTCPNCRTTTDLSDEDADDTVWPRFAAAISDWQDGTADADVTCPACARDVPLDAWIWADDRLAVGRLGLEFWNWPELSDDFRARLAAVLDGHRTAYLWGKL